MWTHSSHVTNFCMSIIHVQSSMYQLLQSTLAVLCVSMWMSCRMSREEVQSESEQLYTPAETEKFPTKDFLLARTLRCFFSQLNHSLTFQHWQRHLKQQRGGPVESFQAAGDREPQAYQAHPFMSALCSSALPARRDETSREEEEEKSRFAVTVALNVGFGRKCRMAAASLTRAAIKSSNITGWNPQTTQAKCSAGLTSQNPVYPHLYYTSLIIITSPFYFDMH